MVESTGIQMPWRYKIYQTYAMLGFTIVAGLWTIVALLTLDFAGLLGVLITFYMMIRVFMLTKDLSEGKLDPVISWLKIPPENPINKIHKHLILFITMEYAVIPLILLKPISLMINQPTFTMFIGFLYYIAISVLILYLFLKIRRTSN